MILLQVLALVTYPPMVSGAQTEVTVSGAAMNGAVAHGHSQADNRGAEDHHHSTEDHSASLARAERATTSTTDGITCHPCCTVGLGACVAVIIAVPGVPEPVLIRGFEAPWFSPVKSRHVNPLPHPPKFKA